MITTNLKDLYFTELGFSDYLDDSRMSKAYAPLSYVNYKLLQFDYCYSQLEKMIDSLEKTTNIELTEKQIAVLTFYSESLIINTRTICDLIVTSFSRLTLKKPNIDSLSKLYRKIDLYEDCKFIQYSKDINERSIRNESFWFSFIYRKPHKSLRDLIVHSKHIFIYPCYIVDEGEFLFLNIERKIALGENSVSVEMRLKEFTIELKTGLYTYLSKFREHIDSMSLK